MEITKKLHIYFAIEKTRRSKKKVRSGQQVHVPRRMMKCSGDSESGGGCRTKVMEKVLLLVVH